MAPTTTTELDEALENEGPTAEERFGQWPDLSRFYGLSYDQIWEMPRKLREIYIFAMIRLRAEEEAIAVEAASYPHTKDEDRRRLMRRLEIRMGHFHHSGNEAETVSGTDLVARQKMAQIGFTVVDKYGHEVSLEDLQPENQSKDDDD